MLTKETLEQIQKLLLEDEVFANSFSQLSSVEEIVQALNNKRLAITKDEAQELIKLSQKALADIPETELDQVSGGVKGAEVAAKIGAGVGGFVQGAVSPINTLTGDRNRPVEVAGALAVGTIVAATVAHYGKKLYNKYF